MKRMIFTLLLMILPGLAIITYADDWQGKGTEKDPYQITNKEDFKRMAIKVNNEQHAYKDTFFVQTTDIDLQNEPWTPIGRPDPLFGRKYFGGNFDGRNFKIENLNIDGNFDPSFDLPAGLFGYVMGSTIKNIHLKSGKIQPSKDCMHTVGGVVGSGDDVTLINCHNEINISAGMTTGGIIGRISNGNVLYCSNRGTIAGISRQFGSSGAPCFATGGIIGYGDGIISNCSNMGDVFGTTTTNGFVVFFTGGVAGWITKGKVVNCINNGTIKSNGQGGSSDSFYHTGGIAGESDVLEFSNCVNNGNVYGESGKRSYIGGISGMLKSNKLENCQNNATIDGSTSIPASYIGGISGYGGSTGNNSFLYNYGEVKGAKADYNYVGGLFGKGIGNVSGNCYFRQDLSGINKDIPGVSDMGSLTGENNIKPLTTTAFKEASNFTGWNVGTDSSAWYFRNTNKNYPVLKSVYRVSVKADNIFKKQGTSDPGLTHSFTGGVPVLLSGALSRESGETTGVYKINQGSLKETSGNFDMNFLSGSFFIMDSDEPVKIVSVQVVGSDNTGQFNIDFSFPTNSALTGSFLLQFPEGVTLDMEQTLLSDELSKNFDLVITPQKNNTWLLEIKAKSLKSLTETGTYQTIMDIAYQVDPALGKGTYEALIKDLDFELNDGTHIIEQERAVNIEVLRYGTAIDKISSGKGCIYLSDQNLVVDTENAESIEIYSVSGVKLYSGSKAAGKAEINISGLPQGVLIVRGGSGWTTKVVK